MLISKMYCVYKHTSPSGKVYIGITSLYPQMRWKNGYGYKRNKYFYRAILKHGWDNFKHEILFTGLTKEQAKKKEMELIAFYNSTDKRKGYNKSLGGDTPVITDDARRKMSLSHKGILLSEKHKEGLSRARKNRKIQPNTGKKLSDEWKKAVSDGLSKSVIQYDLNGNYIATYDGQKQASNITGVCATNISRCCRNERRQAGGYLWRFANGNKNEWVS